MELYKVWCEWDIGLNVSDSIGVYSHEDNLYNHLNSVDWSYLGYDNWEEVLEDGLLDISTIEG